MSDSQVGGGVTRVASQASRDGGELLEVKLHEGVGEEPGVLLRVALGHVHHVRLENDGPDLPVSPDLMERCHRPVVPQPVLAPDDAEPRDVPLLVQQVKPLRRGRRRQPRYHVHIPADDFTT